MRTSDFTSKPTAKVMNETLNKKFGEKLDIDNYSDEQLEKAAGLIESRIAVLKKGKFNETLESEEFHRLKLMQDIVKTAITERAKNKYAIGMAAAKKHPGFKKAASMIAKKQGISKDRAGAILAAGARKASPAAVKANPRLKKVSGMKKGK